ncbi:MAG TPA: FGGY-family carbohydrate kinase [Candidatus Angelobacter sp.]|jgi:xylulokinase|nr:FGGY-family carbohydrate kinase [Candidatus Angelobacter sp.]
MARLLAVDLGGTSVRAAVVDSDGGNVVASARRAVETVLDAPPLGRSYDAPLVWEQCCAAIREALYRAGGVEPVVGVAATAQRIGMVALDDRGRAVYAGPNLDSRGVATAWAVTEAGGDDLYARTGRSLALMYAPARLVWFRQERPEDFARIRRVLGLGDWLAMQLCGEAATEPSTATDLLAYDVRAGEYWSALWSGCGLDPSWLPPLLSAGSHLGGVTEVAAGLTGLAPGTPVAVCAPDSTAAMLGAGASRPGTTLVLAGSTLPVLAASEGVATDPEGRVWVGPHAVAGRGVVESSGGTAGYGWAWCVERLVGGLSGLEGDAAYGQAERLAAAAPAGAREALLFSGGAGVLNATRPATFLSHSSALVWPTIVLQPELGAGEVVRASLESVAHAARANLEQVEAVAGGAVPARLAVAGGMARSRLFLRIVAALVDRPVHTPRGDATMLGAAACAAVAAGVFADLDGAAESLGSVEVAAEPEAELVAAYAAAHRSWRALYARLESL